MTTYEVRDYGSFEDGVTVSRHRTLAAAEKALERACYVTEVWDGKRVKTPTTATINYRIVARGACGGMPPLRP